MLGTPAPGGLKAIGTPSRYVPWLQDWVANCTSLYGEKGCQFDFVAGEQLTRRWACAVGALRACVRARPSDSALLANCYSASALLRMLGEHDSTGAGICSEDDEFSGRGV